MSDFKITDKNGIKLKTANKYVTEDLTVTLTDDDINNTVAENIKKDITILGVTGIFEGGEGGITPSGKIEITNTEEINVTNYATAQVVDSNLSAENIKKDVSILGVTGTFEGGSSSEDRLKKLLDATKTAHGLFYHYTGTSVDDLISYSDTENVTDMDSMFENCYELQTIPQLYTSKVTTMSGMFNSCQNLQTIPQLDTSKVIRMDYMFHDCQNLQTIPQLNTIQVTRMDSMFATCTNLTTIPQLDTRNVTNMSSMFYVCKKLQTIPQLNTSNVTNMNRMFDGCSNLQAISQLSTSRVTNMTDMFNYCSKLQTIDLTHMKIRSTSYSNGMCTGCHSLTKFIIRNMDTIPVLNSNAFDYCYHFTGTVDETYNPQGLKDGRIYVPDNMVDQLKQAANWKKYASIIVPLSTLKE